MNIVVMRLKSQLADAQAHAEQAEADRDGWKELCNRTQAKREALEAALREGRCKRCGEWFRDSIDAALTGPGEPE